MRENAKAKGSKFEGTSNQGDFNEALQKAIAAALEGLSSTLITWRLLEVSGENGGFVGANNLTVTIEAQVP